MWRTLLAYAALALCRVCFLAYNTSAIGTFGLEELSGLIYGAFRFDTISIVYILGPWLFLSLLPSAIRWRGWYREVLFWYYSAAILISVTLNLSDAIYFRYTGKRVTAEELFFASNSNSMELILRFMLDNWILVIVGVATTVAACLLYGRRAGIKAPDRRWQSYVANAVVLCAAITACIAGVRGGLSRMARPTSIPYAMRFASDGAKANLILSNPFCVIRTIGSGSTEIPHYFDDSEMNELFSPLHHPRDGESPCSGYNIVLFVMESMSAEHSAFLTPEAYALREEKGYTPFLDSLMEDGYTYRRMYASGKRSIQALPSIWSSIPSLREPFMLMAESLGETRALPRILRDNGYHTAFFCGSERGSMGFDAYASHAGFEESYSMEDYEKARGHNDFDQYWGIWDDRFMDYMGEVLGSFRQPFMASMFTISSHHPFVVPERETASLPKGETPVQKCVRFVDNGFRTFFEKYGGTEWFANTLFVFVADHVSSEKMLPSTELSPEDHHVIGFLYSPGGAVKGEDIHPASQLDIMPTVLGLAGIDESYFAFGCDTMVEPEHPVIVFDNVFKAFTDEYVYEFDGERIQAVYSVRDTTHSFNLYDRMDTTGMECLIKAYIQQYYTSVSRKRYTVPVSF